MHCFVTSFSFENAKEKDRSEKVYCCHFNTFGNSKKKHCRYTHLNNPEKSNTIASSCLIFTDLKILTKFVDVKNPQ